jgi:glycosyltransferase involved in cell wall biosynthesis
MSTATIVIPCFNEAKRLDLAAFEQFAAENPEVNFLFVDDGSTDETQQILDGLASRISDGASVLVLEQNSGKAEAVRRGVNRALKSNPAYVGYWDADLATPLPVIRDFSELLEGNPQLQMIMGARVQLLGRHIERSAIRHYAGRIAATAISTSDLFGEPFRTRWIFDAEIIARLIAQLGPHSDPSARDVIYEVPLHGWMDVRGSKIGPSDYLRAAVDLLRIYRHYVRRSS